MANCPECGQNFSSEGVAQHLSRVHAIKDEKVLRRARSHKSVIEPPEPPDPWAWWDEEIPSLAARSGKDWDWDDPECPDCRALFATLDALVAHLINEHPARPT